jgi:RNA polymerase sigma-70 factor (ECF subfamily)
VEAAQKDPRRFGDLYELHFELVYAFVAKRVGDRDQAEDLTSEVFHRALSKIKEFEWRGAPFSSWLVRIAANAITDRGKRASREVVGIEDPDGIAAEPSIAEAERAAGVFKLVEELPEDQKQVIRLRFSEDKSIREIAQAMKKSEGAVKQLQFRGLEKLRDWCAVGPLKVGDEPGGKVKRVSKKSVGKNG